MVFLSVAEGQPHLRLVALHWVHIARCRCIIRISVFEIAKLKQTKAGTGEYIALRYNVLGPAHQGPVIFSMLNIRNPNPKTQDIGIQQLGELMRAIGLASVEDTDQLIGGHLEVKPKILLADEPTSRLDPVTQWESLAMLDRIVTKEQIAIVLVTHDPHIAEKWADRTISLI